MEILVRNCSPHSPSELSEETGNYTTTDQILKQRDEASKAKFEAERIEDARISKVKFASELRDEAAKETLD